MTNDDAYDMGYTDGHQDGAREAWLIATPIIHSLRAALEKIDHEWEVPMEEKGWRALASFMWETAHAALKTPTASAAENKQ